MKFLSWIRPRKAEIDRLWNEYLALERAKADGDALREAREKYSDAAFPNWKEGEARDYVCKRCGKRPPDVTYDHFVDSTVCVGCRGVDWRLALLLALVGGAVVEAVLVWILKMIL